MGKLVGDIYPGTESGNHFSSYLRGEFASCSQVPTLAESVYQSRGVSITGAGSIYRFRWCRFYNMCLVFIRHDAP